jgi:hypothetical protein
MTKHPIEVITSVECRRRWPRNFVPKMPICGRSSSSVKDGEAVPSTSYLSDTRR